jgi:hypothetical protein
MLLLRNTVLFRSRSIVMSTLTTAVDMQSCPQDVPSIPAWFPEVVILARHFAQRGLIETISNQVQLARGRAGHYDVIDFVALLLGYAASSEPTLETFFERLAPFAAPFMALFGRDRLPHRSTLSRFLADVDPACLQALRQLFEHAVCQHAFAGDTLGGLFDRHGQQVLVFDVDATRQVARQRPLTLRQDFPTPRRRMLPVCAAGYTGRKRGEVVRTRTTVLQAHTQQWLGTFSGAGNGDYAAELESACRVIVAYLQAKGLSPAQGLLRLDGLYGTASPLARIQHEGLGFLTRGRDYQLLDHPKVQARLQHPCDVIVQHDETQVQREVFDIGFIADWLEPLPDLPLTVRVIVMRHAAPSTATHVTVGKLIGAQVYELFLTSAPAQRLRAADIVDLYHQRGAFEQVLSDEDQEQDPDRWCSCTPHGQEFWQIVSQWVWNTRLELGVIGQEQALRWTHWSPSLLSSASPTVPLPAEANASDAVVEEAVLATYGPLELAHDSGRARGRFSGQDFAILENGTLRCPAEKILRPQERRTLSDGSVRILYRAKKGDCRSCRLAAACLWRQASGAHPRRVSAVRKRIMQPVSSQAPRDVAPPPSQPAEQRELLWGDVSGCRIRQAFVTRLRRQRVSITASTEAPYSVPSDGTPRLWTRAERAHRRLSWAARLARNQHAAEAPRYAFVLFGIAVALAAYLGLASAPPG